MASSPDIPNAAVAVGRDALIANFQDWFAGWEDYRSIPRRSSRVLDDTVVVCTRESARQGQRHRVWLTSHLVRQQAYLDRAEALRAVGLS